MSWRIMFQVYRIPRTKARVSLAWFRNSTIPEVLRVESIRERVEGNKFQKAAESQKGSLGD
jgi:hypothetical protein